MIPCCVPFTWKICNVKPTDREDNTLDTSRPMVPRDNLLRSYIVWRKAALIFLFPLSLAETILSFTVFAQELQVLTEFDYRLTLFGWLCRLSQTILSPLAQLVGTGLAYAKWTEIKLSQKIFNSATAVSMIIYFWPAFVQIQHIYAHNDFELADIADQNLQTYKEKLLIFASEELTMKIGFTIWLPFFLAIPSGSVRGAQNIMGLVNDSSVPGCLVLLLTPFGTLIHLSIFTSVVQLYGNWLLGLGFLLLVIGKLKVFYFRTLYITGDVKEIDKQKVGLKGLFFSILGVACLLLWSFVTKITVPVPYGSGNPETLINRYLQDKTWVDVIRFAHGWFTKVCLYSLVFTDIVLHIMLNCEGDRQWSCRGMRNFFY